MTEYKYREESSDVDDACSPSADIQELDIASATIRRLSQYGLQTEDVFPGIVMCVYVRMPPCGADERRWIGAIFRRTAMSLQRLCHVAFSPAN